MADGVTDSYVSEVALWVAYGDWRQTRRLADPVAVADAEARQTLAVDDAGLATCFARLITSESDPMSGVEEGGPSRAPGQQQWKGATLGQKRLAALSLAAFSKGDGRATLAGQGNRRGGTLGG
ncbi:hypothetical protein EG327_001104 [Venturia inaequalis]|uniref:Uncharacterized protein n=1 Tax=Venturia inaequalis TaxID=5025 RepID=A0A8H3ZET5_VENIN|nr:hypothetical protein EG327_001104 [Venturia inaequalis]